MPKKNSISPPPPGNELKKEDLQVRVASAWEKYQKEYEKKEQTTTKKFFEDDHFETPKSILENLKECKQLFSSKRFDPTLELLYQRYFFKLNQNNMTVILLLFSLVCMTEIVFHYVGGSRTVLKGTLLGLVILTFLIIGFFANRSSFNNIQVG